MHQKVHIDNLESNNGTMVLLLIAYRNKLIDDINNQSILPEDLIKEKSDIINDLIFGYFEEDRLYVPIRGCNENMTYINLISYLNDEVLDYIAEERPGLLECLENGLYIYRETI